LLSKTVITLAALAAAAGAAHALEPMRNYDSFGTVPIDTTRWSETERVRQIERGALRLMQRSVGAAGSDAGITSINWNENVTDPAAVTAIKARVTVNAVEAASCAANASAGQSRARIIGGFFNVGAPTPGSQVGDVIAQIRVTRFSNSTDPAGTLRVQGIASICQNAECSSTTTIGNIVDLGTATLGQSLVVQIQWDQPAKTFLFGRDGVTGGSVAYTNDDSNPPGVPFKQLSTRLDLPNCQSAPRTIGSVDATFDNVGVNRSAAP
jgi:hypothetical protein